MKRKMKSVFFPKISKSHLVKMHKKAFSFVKAG